MKNPFILFGLTTSKNFTLVILSFTFYIFLSSCSVSRQIDKVAKEDIINDKELTSAHVGISIYDPSTKKYLYEHNSDKYFTPASNTKIITCYAAMKYLGDSIIGLRYKYKGDTLFLLTTGDPTLMHSDFTYQPVTAVLKNVDSNATIVLNDANFQDEAWGTGWSWDDYAEDYMPERSAVPIYGNVVEFDGTSNRWSAVPSMNGKIIDSGGRANYLSKVDRDLASNSFTLYFNGTTEKKIDVPFITKKGETNVALLQAFTKAKILNENNSAEINKNEYSIIHSQPVDSLLKITMHRSDNFYAEQSLLMVSNELLGVMNDKKIIDTLLKTDYKEMPQKPSWVDGSGLSRFNLFTPNDFIFVLNKMRNEFNWNRITTIFATGGTGTLGATYQNLEGKIFAKTGTLSNNIALSGFIITNKKKVLIFSILVANHLARPSYIRNTFAKFLSSLVEKY